jgi:hypothetical protein
MNKFLKITINLILLLSFGLTSGPGRAQAQATMPDIYCRFGLGVPNGLLGYDLSILGLGAYLDWNSNNRGPQVPQAIQYLRVLRVSDHLYASTLASIPNLVKQNPGQVWIIGNEPDSEVSYQDHVSAPVYGNRYYHMATAIRNNDPTARIAFGTVIQPTKIRRYYMELAMDEMDKWTKSRAATLGLIDIVSIHNFILNEQKIYVNGETVSWGSGVPLGYVAGVWPEPEILRVGGENDDLYKIYDAATFAERIKITRQWMFDKGLKDKQLWVTEYGNLLPSVGDNYINIPDSETAEFMAQTIDFMLTAKDNTTGYAPDEYRLVQHFVWYSLNEDRFKFGGSFYDPIDKSLTPVGQRYMNYDPPASAEAGGLERQPADLYILPNSLIVLPVGTGNASGLVNYHVMLRASNQIPSEYRTEARVELKANGVVVGEQTLFLPRCSGQTVFNFLLKDRLPGEQLTLSAKVFLIDGNGPETDTGNDTWTFPPLPLSNYFKALLPQVFRIR